MIRDLTMRRIRWAVVSACFAISLAAGQNPGSVVNARVVFATEAAHAGSPLQAAVVAEVAPGYHINDHKPSLDYLIPTELKLDDSRELSVERLAYPKGQPRKFEFSDTALSVYEGTVRVGALLKVARAAQPGTYTVKGKLTYQACDDHACLAPASLPVVIAVKVVGPGVPVKRLNEDVFSKIQFN
jgi:DsbC/DsbD-like thiol-disulfide interchange protein